MNNIAIIGRKRSGKDTAAAALVEELGYTRLGFADPLKDAALALNPIVEALDPDSRRGYALCEEIPEVREAMSYSREVRLAALVDVVGWETAKDRFPEVRRILQRLGDEAGRQVHGEGTWIAQLLDRIERANAAGNPVVVPDVRYPNEVGALDERGFVIVRITRPGYDVATPGEHASEKVDALPYDIVVINDRDRDALRRSILDIAKR
ncbi:hypothetical protein HUO13_11995 [Saccharopolyspora erythraea]|uniref:hypothetical protein n=1 Tax=Saccharopolyspora erythraea TaxID=1836 RepID=UPI001BA4E302|nr:hypothetical protein [Saccharopolyspora erythraea]QUH01435.1 hypothetical protein HUO13_11995 [Saccharopolyspora erythraea]